MNVLPKNYGIAEFYDRMIDLRRHSFSWSLIARRLKANPVLLGRSLNFIRAVSSEGFGRLPGATLKNHFGLAFGIVDDLRVRQQDAS